MSIGHGYIGFEVIDQKLTILLINFGYPAHNRYTSFALLIQKINISKLKPYLKIPKIINTIDRVSTQGLNPSAANDAYG